MNFTSRKTWAALAAAAALAGCGGGGDDAAAPSTALTSTPGATAQAGLPASAQQSVTGLVAFLNQLIGQTGETAEPIALGDATLPTSEVDGPSALN